MKKIEFILNKFPVLIIFCLCIIFSLMFGNINETVENNYGLIFITIGVFLLFVSFIILDKIKKFKGEYTKIFIFGILFVVYIGYVLNTNCGTRQHDTRSLNWENGGHFGYIQYILENSKLPDFNPTSKWCFTNPPLFYIISAIFIKIQNIIGRYDYQAIENLQYLTVFFTMTFNIYIYKIMKLLNIKKMKNHILLFVGLSPAIVFLSGSLNNDILSIMLVTIAIYYTILWYKNSKLSDLIKIALSISLAMMTKINSAIVAIPIAVVFLIKLIKEKENFKRYILYYIIFALIAFPIGLWFPIKNLIKYNIPVTYVQTVVEGTQNDGYIGNKNVFERFFKVDKEHLKTVNLKFEKGKSDYNILFTTLKSFIVDEQIDFSNNNILRILIWILFISAVVIGIIFFISLIKIKNIDVFDLFWYTLFFSEIICYLKFCFEYPYSFSMNFRYIVPIIIPVMVVIGKYSEENEKIYKLTQRIIYIFSIFSIILFINL